VHLFFVARLCVVTLQFLSRNHKLAVLIIAAVAAVITPTPDHFNLGWVMFPLLLMHEIGLLPARLACRLARGQLDPKSTEPLECRPSRITTRC
jgi:sec-independent protein translocase protein TatC